MRARYLSDLRSYRDAHSRNKRPQRADYFLALSTTTSVMSKNMQLRECISIRPLQCDSYIYSLFKRTGVGYASIFGSEKQMRITHGSPYYYRSKVTIDDKEITDFIWADEEAGEVMSVTYGPRDAQGFRSETKKLLKGKVKIVMQ